LTIRYIYNLYNIFPNTNSKLVRGEGLLVHSYLLKRTRVKDIISFASAFITAILPFALPPEIINIIWRIFLSVAMFFISRFIYSYFFLPTQRLPDIPKTIEKFENAIVEAKYNLCSTSTKEIALWQSPTFLYYLHINTLKVISEKAHGTTDIDFSNKPEDKTKFYDEGRKLVEDLAYEKRRRNILTKFIAIRFFIYPEEVYAEKKEEIKSLISIHAINSIHCIPIIRERLIAYLNPNDIIELQKLSEKLRQRIEDELPSSMARWDKMKMKIKNKNNPYKQSLPDFLIVDAYKEQHKKSLLWYEGNEPKAEDDKNLIEQAEKVFSILAKTVYENWKSVVWNEYESKLFNRVPIFIKPQEKVTFFGKEYYWKWINEIVPNYQKLNDWIKKEEETIKKIVKENKISNALDVGCGWGRLMEILLKEGVTYCAGIDVEPSMIMKANTLYKKFPDKVCIQLGDATELAPFKDESFDLVICTTNTFGNMRNEERAKTIRQIHRVLKKDGIFVLSVYAHTNEAKRLREESYMVVGLTPYYTDDPTVIETHEGLYSKQFKREEIEKYLSEFRMIEDIKSVNQIAFIVIARK